jgi:hypothetical protein
MKPASRLKAERLNVVNQDPLIHNKRFALPAKFVIENPFHSPVGRICFGNDALFVREIELCQSFTHSGSDRRHGVAVRVKKAGPVHQSAVRFVFDGTANHGRLRILAVRR